jgi:hypothetical protein
MWHRHLTHSDWTLATVDDTIARGRLEDWKRLRDAASQEEVRDRIRRVCAAHRSDPRAQRYHFWDCYVRTDVA